MDLLESSKLPHILRRLSINDFKKFNTFRWNGSHINAVLCYVLKSRSSDHGSIDLLNRIEESRDTSRYTKMVLSFTERLREFFTVPEMELANNCRTTSELLASFLDFLLDVVEQVVSCHANLIDQAEDQIEILQKELKFLISVLGDEPFRCSELDETKCLMKDIEAVANEAGIFLYLYFFTDEGEHSRIDISLSRLIKKFQSLKTMIKGCCITVFKKPNCAAPNTALDSLFIVDTLLDDLEHLVDQKSDLIIDVWDEIKNLQKELMLLRSFLETLKEQQHMEIKKRVRDATYEAEYLINSFLASDIPIWYLTLRISDVIAKIKLASVGFEETMKIVDSRYIINSVLVGDIPIWYPTPKIKNHYVGAPRNARDPKVETEPQIKKLTGVDGIIGFKDEIIKIADQLTGGPKQLQIISIFGMPGLGKTTLAKKLYDDPTVVMRFDCCAWCVVSQIYRKRNLLVHLLSTVSDLEHDKIIGMETENLGVELHKNLMGRRYLIILDDVWSSYELDDIRRYLPGDGNGSRILLTSRHKDVVPSDSIIHPLPFLSNDQCWELLRKKVLQKDDVPQELVDLGRKIAEHCQGLPLAVVVIASALANMDKKKSLWSEVAGSLSSQISEDPNKLMSVLELSYEHLPSHLKPCFLYFGAFPEYREISVWKLVSLWIAEGFVQKQEQKSLNEVAEDYLMEMINRGLVLVSRRRPDGGIKSCSIHDLLREMCLRKAKEDNFLNLIKDRFSIYERHHRLCINSDSIHNESRPFGHHIRSWFGYWPDVTLISSRLKLLRVLDLSTPERPEDLRKAEDLDLTGVEQLVHLRYMEVKLTANCITPSIGSLLKLEFLVLDGHGTIEIPETLLNLVKLRNLYIRKHAQFSDSFTRRVIMEKGMQMSNLESISNLRMVHENDEKILKWLPSLSRLKCETKPLWDSVEMCRRYLVLDRLTRLESLSISRLDSEFKSSCTINFPESLKKLTLREFKLSSLEMSMIGRLPRLEVLKLLYTRFDGKEWKTNEDEFQELKFLKLEALQIRRWNMSSEHFPKLEQLVIHKCWKLKKFPSSLGDISTLQSIDIHSCRKSVADSALQIQKEQLEMGYEELKVNISGSCW
ncbi:putative late blight resistance protein homolog R1A-3 [Henckelia pumila]|uniref:putative late blight resistance protein homolog R1A-3 n=1 Tax=Henckelia pumila TaxID=405737 RepID=UPI003C6E6AA8